jgi:hypothetical protein
MDTKDTKMDEDMKQEEVMKEEDEKVPVTLPLPPLVAAARRLERLLGGGDSDKNRLLHSYTNPAKVVRRWLGTASGASAQATLESIASAANALLDSEGRSAAGKSLLVTEGEGMDTTSDGKVDDKYLTKASEREVESWLLSLMVRINWKEQKFSQAFELSQKSITILVNHISAAGTNVTTASGPGMASLFPLLARMYRYQSLVAESLSENPQVAATLRQEMIKAHGMASLRRDVDSQATLLNLMLRDLLHASQGTNLFFCIIDSKVFHLVFNLSPGFQQWSKHKSS